MMSARATLVLLAIAATCGTASAQVCRGRPGSLIEENGGNCPANCFDDPANQVVLSGGSPGSNWIVGISQCIKPESVSFITWSPVDENGGCSDSCGNKVEEIPAGDVFVGLPIPYGACEGDPICVYVHDGQLSRGSGGSPLGTVPDGCVATENQLCELCGAYVVTPKLTGAQPCDDAYTCTTGDACTPDAECAGTPDSSLCDDGFACTGNVCVGDQNPLLLGVDLADLADDGSGCGFPPNDGFCDDGIGCTEDICVAGRNPATWNIDPADVDSNGCGSRAVTAYCEDPANFGPFGNCVAPKCMPDTSTDPSGCIVEVVSPSPCGLTTGQDCGSSTCNVATGNCDTDSVEVPGQCPDCANCINNVCTGGCPDCQKCVNDVCVIDEGATCSINGGDCFCNAQGVCNICLTDCPASDPTDPNDTCANDEFRACAEAVGSPGQATCGDVTCTILCQQKCRTTNSYVSSDCNNQGGCSCGGPNAATSVLDPTQKFTGPCCRCTAIC